MTAAGTTTQICNYYYNFSLIDTPYYYYTSSYHNHMILIWNGEGGPLQWLCLVIFCIQFIAPHFIQLSVDLRNAGASSSSSSITLDDIDYYFPFLWVAMWLIVAGLTFWICMGMWQRQQRAQQQQHQVGGHATTHTTSTTGGGNRAETNTAPSGSADNPVVIEDDENNAHNFGGRGLYARINSMLLQSISPSHFMLALGFALPLIMSFPLVWNLLLSKGFAGLFSDSGFVQVSTLAVAAHSVMAIAAYRVLRDVLDSGGVGQYPGNNRQGGRRRRMRKLTVSEIADIGTKLRIKCLVVDSDDVENLFSM